MLYARPFTSNHDRADALPAFLHTYNHHRGHTALNGQPPINRVSHPAKQHTWAERSRTAVRKTASARAGGTENGGPV